MSDAQPVIVVEDISKTFHVPDAEPVHALRHVTNHVDRGEVLVVIGPSGSGKSTFLRALNGLQPVDSGSITIDGVELTAPRANLDKLRQKVGMVFQHFNLFQHKTILENITMPQTVVLKRSSAEATEVGRKLLERVGIADKADRYPSQISGGQQQRVAIARSLAMNPTVMLFDEVTSALDPETGALWTVEHGAKGGDEINRPEAGRNYGWPVISYGTTYAGTQIGAGTEKAGMEQPLHYWDPSIAPSGMMIYSGRLWPGWRGDIFVGALKFKLISRLDREGDSITGEERLFEGVYGRVRDVREGPGGAIWFLTDEAEGALYRVTPAE